MLNKLQFNNLVITNKKLIQQVKAQSIQKLVQKIRKLKALLEKRPDDEKNKNRLRKTTESMEELKALKRVDIMKRILLLDKNPSAVLTNGLATPDEIAIATLASNKTMQSLVSTFKTQLNLQEGDPSWKKELMRLSKRRFKMMRTEQKREKRKTLKEQKAMARKRMEWLRGNNEKTSTVGEEPSIENANMSTSGVWHEEPLSPAELKTLKAKENELKKPTIKAQREPVQGKQEKIKKSKENSDKPKLKTVKVQEAQLPKEEAIGSEINNEKQTAKAVLSSPSFVKTEIVDNFMPKAKSPSPEAADQSADEATHVIDPFFITDSGENYRSTAINQRESDSPYSTQFPIQKQVNGGGPAKRARLAYEKPLNRREKRQQQKYEPKASTKENPTPNDLHPSWAAKQKFKPVITGFQGKKIVFDDANGDVQNMKKNYNTKGEGRQNFGPKGARKDSPVTNDLHPSWAAKQKCKPIIADFKGKKIVFDANDDNSTTNTKAEPMPPAKKPVAPNADSNLHPSWAAKQKMKPAITEFQGKKITFDDDA